jgi:hypothetical protein
MTLEGTGCQALVDLFAENWQTDRSFRNRVPELVGQPEVIGPQITDYESNQGVIVTEDRQVVNRNQQVHDLIHCYHPEGIGWDQQDTGFKEVNTVETVQIDIECADRTINGERSSARVRMVGDRRDDDTQDYAGIKGEVQYILENERRGFDEWDVVRIDPVAVILKNSNARVSLNVELERISRNTPV